MRLGRLLWRGGTALITSTLVATPLVVAGAQPAPPSASPETTPASGSTYLCTGYAGCRNAGYSDAGYGAVNNRMYWRMYSGHNCTNYAAYRMIQAGMSTERPWGGTGMAYNWGHAGPTSPTSGRASGPWRGGTATPVASVPAATSRTSSGWSPPTRSSSARTPGAATSTGARSPATAAGGRPASSTSSTSPSRTPRRRSSRARRRSASS